MFDGKQKMKTLDNEEDYDSVGSILGMILGVLFVGFLVFFFAG